MANARKNVALINHTIDIRQERSIIGCFLACIQTLRCVTLNVLQENHGYICQLSDFALTNAESDEILFKAGVLYIELDVTRCS